jgi:pimeloyl-ACP methyl ester carboxylesterase
MKVDVHKEVDPTDEKLGESKSWALRIPCGEVTLSGDLEIPANAIGLVLFAHGSGSSRFSRRNRAEAYTRHLRFDIGLLTRRLVTVTEEMVDDARVRGLGLGYFGSSTGGAAALRAAAALGSKIKAVVSRGGRPDLAGDALHYVKAATLLIVGERDEEVLRLNETAYEQLNCEKALAVVPDATHLFEEPGALEEVARLAAEWFAKHLKSQL